MEMELEQSRTMDVNGWIQRRMSNLRSWKAQGRGQRGQVEMAYTMLGMAYAA